MPCIKRKLNKPAKDGQTTGILNNNEIISQDVTKGK
jgi:hypothetical protein